MPSVGETIEAAVIVSVLLSFVEQIMATGKLDSSAPPTATSTTTGLTSFSNGEAEAEDETKRRKNLVKRMRIQIWAGTLTGFGIALAIGAAFIAVVSFGFTRSKTSLLLRQSRQILRLSFDI